jgi:hypothetical protein
MSDLYYLIDLWKDGTRNCRLSLCHSLENLNGLDEVRHHLQFIPRDPF